jgi:hypothetical protein
MVDCAHQHTIHLGTCYWCFACHKLVTKPYGKLVSEIPFVCTDSDCPSWGKECTSSMQGK